jgi:hypothetical protein
MATALLADDRATGRAIRRLCNFHRQGPDPSVMIMSTPRSGSTWLMEMVRTQPGFKSCEEPLNLRNPQVAAHLGISDWHEMYAPGAERRIRHYVEGFMDGRLRFMDHRPFKPHHRWVTNRIVFKVLHGAEEHVEMFQGLGLSVVHLIRHPLPVALSRREVPRLDSMLSDANLSRYPAALAERARTEAAGGDHIAAATVAWCLQNAPILASPNVSLVTYEQLVAEPEVVVGHLAGALGLPDPARMLARVGVPSHSHAATDDRRRNALESGGRPGSTDLIEAWRDTIDPDAARRAMDIVTAFGIDIYRLDSGMPNEHHMITDPNRHEAPQP